MEGRVQGLASRMHKLDADALRKRMQKLDADALRKLKPVARPLGKVSLVVTIVTSLAFIAACSASIAIANNVEQHELQVGSLKWCKLEWVCVEVRALSSDEKEAADSWNPYRKDGAPGLIGPAPTLWTNSGQQGCFFEPQANVFCPQTASSLSVCVSYETAVQVQATAGFQECDHKERTLFAAALMIQQLLASFQLLFTLGMSLFLISVLVLGPLLGFASRISVFRYEMTGLTLLHCGAYLSTTISLVISLVMRYLYHLYFCCELTDFSSVDPTCQSKDLHIAQAQAEFCRIAGPWDATLDLSTKVTFGTFILFLVGNVIRSQEDFIMRKKSGIEDSALETVRELIRNSFCPVYTVSIVLILSAIGTIFFVYNVHQSLVTWLDEVVKIVEDFGAESYLPGIQYLVDQLSATLVTLLQIGAAFALLVGCGRLVSLVCIVRGRDGVFKDGFSLSPENTSKLAAYCLIFLMPAAVLTLGYFLIAGMVLVLTFPISFSCGILTDGFLSDLFLSLYRELENKGRRASTYLASFESYLCRPPWDAMAVRIEKPIPMTLNCSAFFTELVPLLWNYTLDGTQTFLVDLDTGSEMCLNFNGFKNQTDEPDPDMCTPVLHDWCYTFNDSVFSQAVMLVIWAACAHFVVILLIGLIPLASSSTASVALKSLKLVERKYLLARQMTQEPSFQASHEEVDAQESDQAGPDLGTNSHSINLI